MRKYLAALMVFSLFFACADVMHAQSLTTPPSEASDFSANFHAYAASSTVVQLFLQNIETPASAQIQWLPGFETGHVYMDSTNRRVRFDFATIDGTPQQTQWFFLDKYKEYTLDATTGSCQVTLLDPNFRTVPFWLWLSDSTLVKTGKTLSFSSSGNGPGSKPSFVNTQTWQYIFPDGSPVYSESLTSMENSSRTPVALYWMGVGGKGPALLTFDTFRAGQQTPACLTFRPPVMACNH